MQYLGGVGDGAWYTLEQSDTDKLRISRYTSRGELEYAVDGTIQEPFDSKLAYAFTYDSHLLFTHIVQNCRTIRIQHSENIDLQQINQKNSQELYA